MDNQQPNILMDKGSTTISKESTGIINSGKQQLYRNVIYKITCIPTNKCYIGSASYYSSRIGTHIHFLQKGKHKNIYLQNAWNKYGRYSFEFEIIEKCNNAIELPDREMYWITYYNSLNREKGFNICPDTRSRRGAKMPESAKIKIGNFWRGKKFSIERILAVREARTTAQGKAVNVYDNDMNYITSYPSISEAARQFNVSIASISKQCSLERITKRKVKYRFRYKDIV